MGNLLKNIFDKIENKKYEDNLYRQFGQCKEYKPLGIKILFITDTHNCLANDNELVNYLKSLDTNEYDLCLLLGDMTPADITIIKSIVPNYKIYGIVGNHDSIRLLEENEIRDINGKVIECKGIRIAAMMGSNRYKKGDYGMITQEESLELAKNMESADLFVSHDRAFIKDNNDVVHDGLKGITYYLYKNNIPVHVHGHLHNEFEEVLKNNTRSICLYKIKLLKL